MAQNPPVEQSRAEKVLAAMVIASIGLSILCFIAVMIGTATGAFNNPDALSGGVWPVVIVLPLVGLPIGVVLIITLIVLNGARRRRAAQQSH